MAFRQGGFGMTAEMGNNKASSFDAELAREAMTWIEAVVPGCGCRELGDREEKVAEKLKDGVILCKVINNIKPGSVTDTNESKMAFKQMDNIDNFLSACEAIGFVKTDLFQTVDLYESQNIPQVINGIHALGRKAKDIGYAGPTIGPKAASENKREFSEEQRMAGMGMVGLQMGANKTHGGDFGKPRAIVD